MGDYEFKEITMSELNLSKMKDVLAWFKTLELNFN